MNLLCLAVLDDIGRDVCEVTLQCLPYIRNVDVVVHLEHGGLTLQMEGQHAPVHAVGAIPLCCVLLSNVGEGAQHSLAGSRLLTGRAVTRLVGIDSGTDLHFLCLHILLSRDGVDHLDDLSHLRCYLAGQSLLLQRLYRLGTTYILRISSGKCELSQSQRVGTIGGGLTGRNQLIGGGYLIEDLGRHLQEHIVSKLLHLRPILDVRAEAQCLFLLGLGPAVVNSCLVGLIVVVVLRNISPAIHGLCRGQLSAVGCGCCDGTCIHQCHCGHLAVSRLGALTVREVSGGMTDGQCVVGRCVTGTEARSAECRTDHRTGIHEVCQQSLTVKVCVYRL